MVTIVSSDNNLSTTEFNAIILPLKIGGTYQLEITGTSACGDATTTDGASSCTSTFEVIDDEAPIVDCSNIML